MTTEETRQAAEVMLAFANGRGIEWKYAGMVDYCWRDVIQASWDWVDLEYRVKPEPEQWAAKIWVHSNGGCLPYRDREPEDLWADAGWRLIFAKEVLE